MKTNSTRLHLGVVIVTATRKRGDLDFWVALAPLYGACRSWSHQHGLWQRLRGQVTHSRAVMSTYSLSATRPIGLCLSIGRRRIWTSHLTTGDAFWSNGLILIAREKR